MTLEILKYGEKNGQVAGIDEVERGVACDCTCLACGQELIALKGERQTHRFEHFREMDCEFSVQASLLKMVKEIVEKNRKMMIPAVTVKFGEFPKMTWELSGEREIAVEQVAMNTGSSKSYPSLIVQSGGHQLAIVVTLVSSMEQSKEEEQNRLEKSRLSVIELTFGETEGWPSQPELEAIILGSDSRKRWAFNRKADEVKSAMKRLSVLRNQEYVCESVEPKGVSRMIARSKRRVVDDYRTCEACYYCVGGERGAVICSLETGIRNADEYKAYIRRHGIGVRN